MLTALRVMEVRAAYCEDDFEWDVCRGVASDEIKASNLHLMRESMDLSYSADHQSEPENPV